MLYKFAKGMWRSREAENKKQGKGEETGKWRSKEGESEAEENGKSEEAEKQRVERESKSTGRLKIKNISLNRKNCPSFENPFAVL